MKTDDLIQKIDNNFFYQRQIAREINEYREVYKNPGFLTDFIYGGREAVAAKIKSKIKLLRRLRSINAVSIDKLAQLNKK